MEQVDSPNEARAYGTGEVIIIDVVFNQEVTLEGEPTLMLETGVFNQEVKCACCRLFTFIAAMKSVRVFPPAVSMMKATTSSSIPAATPNIRSANQLPTCDYILPLSLVKYR